MGYRDLITAQMEAIYQKGIANKILQFMQKIRNESDEGQARRWAMELLQNGRDVAYKDSSLRARFELQEDRLIYSHTGMPFKVKDILSIIYQVSSKLPGGESIGRFGTGFMSTYQLCEKVQLNGVLKDAGEQYCPFQVLLDRTGTEVAEILEKIEESVKQIYRAEEVLREEEFQKENYNTTFTYYLETSLNKQTAKIGMEDMKENVLYIMLFSDKVQEITLVNRLGEVKSEISYMRRKDVCLKDNIHCLTILEKNQETGKEKEHRMLYLTENNVTITARMDEKNCLLPISGKTSRLFLDFPLIGTEEFPFPVVVNSRRFQPNEPRSGIALSDNINSKDSIQNKEVMREAVSLYGVLFAYAVEEHLPGLEHMISIPAWRENKEHSENWVKCNLYKHLYVKIASQPFLMTNDGKRALGEGCVSLVRGIPTNEGKGVRELLLQLRGYRIPLDDVDWPEILSGYEMTERKVIGLPELLQNASGWMKLYLENNKMPPLLWLQKLYYLGMENEEQALLIRSGQIRIYPNQNQEDWEQKLLYTAQEIKVDNGIPEILKDVSEQLDILDSMEEAPIHVRKSLLHKEFRTKGEIPEFEWSRLLEYIRRRSDRRFPVIRYSVYKARYEQAWKNAWELLLSCGEDEMLYRLYQKTVPYELPPYQKEEKLSVDVFWNAKVNVCKMILETVQSCVTLEKVKNTLCLKETPNQMYNWINQMLERTSYYLTEQEVLEYRVFPNQEGILTGRYIKGDFFYGGTILKLDEVKNEELKEILRVFADEKPDCNLYSELLDRRIQLKNSSLMVVTDDTVAIKLNTVIQQLLSEHNISDVKPEYQDACTRLLAYIQEEPESARRNFPGFCTEEAQMRLLSPKAAVRIQRQAKQMQQLFVTLGVESPEEVLELLRNTQQMADREAGVLMDEFGDVSLDEEWEFGSEQERQKQMRQIGICGEQYAFAEICRGFSDWREEEKTEHRAVFVSEQYGLRAVVDYPDTENYKQSGWDISIRFTGKIEKCFYVEVKTHTAQSAVRKLMMLSPQQWMMALCQRKKYAVMMVSYNRQKVCCTHAEVYHDPVELVMKGKIRGTMQKYVFSV